MDEERFPQLVQDLYRLVDAFEQMFPGRHFTPDGHMVGSIGEALAACYYALELLPASTQTHDARTKSGRLVQIKATQGKRVGLRSRPKHLLVLRLNRNGSFEEVYNGVGTAAWNLVKHKPLPSNGQYGIGLATLKKLMRQVPGVQRLPQVRVPPSQR